MAEFTSNEALHGISPQEIREQLARVLSSVRFAIAPQQSRFLRYLVEHSLEKQPDIREQTLGVEVFERGDSFAPIIDPIVRVAATRLRSRLRHYYRTEGKQDPVVIHLKKGGYGTCFRMRTRLSTDGKRARLSAKKALTLAVLPFHNLTVDPEQEFLCDLIVEEIIHALTNAAGLRVIAWSST